MYKFAAIEKNIDLQENNATEIPKQARITRLQKLAESLEEHKFDKRCKTRYKNYISRK